MPLGTRQLGGETPQLSTASAKNLSLRNRIKKNRLPTSAAQGEFRRHRTRNTVRITQESCGVPACNFVLSLGYTIAYRKGSGVTS